MEITTLVDLEKTSDKVARQNIWDVLKRNLIEAIKVLYKKTENLFRKSMTWDKEVGDLIKNREDEKKGK